MASVSGTGQTSCSELWLSFRNCTKKHADFVSAEVEYISGLLTAAGADDYSQQRESSLRDLVSSISKVHLAVLTFSRDCSDDDRRSCELLVVLSRKLASKVIANHYTRKVYTKLSGYLTPFKDVPKVSASIEEIKDLKRKYQQVFNEFTRCLAEYGKFFKAEAEYLSGRITCPNQKEYEEYLTSYPLSLADGVKQVFTEVRGLNERINKTAIPNDESFASEFNEVKESSSSLEGLSQVFFSYLKAQTTYTEVMSKKIEADPNTALDPYLSEQYRSVGRSTAS